jgi:hypothetical protein
MTTISEAPIQQTKERESQVEKGKKNPKPGAFKKYLEGEEPAELAKETPLALIGRLEQTPLSSDSAGTPLPPLSPFSSLSLASAHQTASISPMSEEMAMLVETLASELTVIDAKGITETTVTYASKTPDASVLHNTKIIITEFRTAPKAFNVELQASSEAALLLQHHAGEILASLDAGNYCFKINRLDISLKKSSRLPSAHKGSPTLENDSVETIETVE